MRGHNDKSWLGRLFSRKQLPDYGLNEDVQPAHTAANLDLASELPDSQLYEAGGMADWPDPVFDIDADGYRTIHNCAPVIESVDKRGIRIAKLNWTVHGTGARAEAIASIVNQINGWADMIKWLNWAEIDGVRFMQIKTKAAREIGGLADEPYLVPDFFMGGRRKFKAGGSIQWDGNNLVATFKTTGETTRSPERLPKDQFIIHRPGAGSSPEGDLNISVATYRIAYAWEEAQKNIAAHSELFGVPIRVFKGKLDKVRPDKVSGITTERLNRIKAMTHNKTLMLADAEMIELLEPKGQGFKDMVEYARYLEGVLDLMFLGNQLTSDVKDAERTGNTSVHLEEESEAVFGGAMQIAESLNRHLLPWIIKRNPHLPPLGEGEYEPFLWPQPAEDDDAEQEDDASIEVDDEDIDGTDDELSLIPDDQKADFKEMGFKSAGKWMLFTKEVQQQIEEYKVKGFPPLYRYTTAHDSRVRPNHAALDGFVLTKNAFIRRELAPPNGFNCRCNIVKLSAAENKRLFEAQVERLGSPAKAISHFNNRAVPGGGHRDTGYTQKN